MRGSKHLLRILKRHTVTGAALLATLLVPSFAVAKEAPGLMSVKVDEANFRSGPSTSHEIMFTAIRYYPVKVLKQSKDWVKVADYEGDEAWIAERLLSPEPTVIVAVDNANLREKGDLSSRVVGKVERSQVFRALERDGRWLKIAGDDDALGWIREDLIWGEELATIPEAKQNKPAPRKRAASPRKRKSSRKAKAEQVKAEQVKAEAAKPSDHAKVEPAKKDDAKTDTQNAEQPKDEAAKPKDEAAKPKDEAAKPKDEAAKPKADQPTPAPGKDEPAKAKDDTKPSDGPKAHPKAAGKPTAK